MNYSTHLWPDLIATPDLLSVFLAPKTSQLLSWLSNLLIPKLVISYKKLFCKACMLRVHFYMTDGRWLLKVMVLLLPSCLASGNLGHRTRGGVWIGKGDTRSGIAPAVSSLPRDWLSGRVTFPWPESFLWRFWPNGNKKVWIFAGFQAMVPWRMVSGVGPAERDPFDMLLMCVGKRMG